MLKEPPPVKVKGQKPPGDTPSREAVLTQNAAPDDLMPAAYEEVSRWVVGAADVTEGRLNASAWPASGPPGTRVAVKSV